MKCKIKNKKISKKLLTKNKIKYKMRTIKANNNSKNENSNTKNIRSDINEYNKEKNKS